MKRYIAVLIAVAIAAAACACSANDDTVFESSAPPKTEKSQSADEQVDDELSEEDQGAQKAEQERIAAEEEAAEKAEQERLAAEEAARKAEQERIAAEQAAAHKAEQEKLAAEHEVARKAEQEKPAAEQAAAQKAEQEKAAEEEKSAKKTSSSSADLGLTSSRFKSKVEGEIIDEINYERQRLGLGTLEYDETLTMAARLRSKELCDAGMFEHARPSGDDWNTVLSKEFPSNYRSNGENLAMVESNHQVNRTAEEWFQQWKNSPTHYKSMVLDEFTNVGVGVYVREIDGVYYEYATTLFGWE